MATHLKIDFVSDVVAIEVGVPALESFRDI